MLLHPLKDPVSIAQEARGRAILGILLDDGGSQSEAIETLCRALAGLLHAVRPDFEESRRSQFLFNALWLQVEQWIKRELKPLRFRDAQGRLVT